MRIPLSGGWLLETQPRLFFYAVQGFPGQILGRVWDGDFEKDITRVKVFVNSVGLILLQMFLEDIMLHIYEKDLMGAMAAQALME